MPEEGIVDCVDAAVADAASSDAGKLQTKGYFGIGIYGAKNSDNVGTLWRSSYQMGAQFVFTIGGRYQDQATDTLDTCTRIPLHELPDWSGFATFAPHGAT